MIQKIKDLTGENKNLLDNIIIHSFYNVYNKLNGDDIKRYLLMSIKNMLVNDLGKYKYIKIELAQDDEPIMVFYFNDDMFDTDILENVYTMLQDILYDANYKINLKYESK
jgi:hypothetical protein